MQLTINDQVYKEIQAKTIAELVEEISLETAGTAIAINQKVIGRDDWRTFELSESDEVFIIRATHGG